MKKRNVYSNYEYDDSYQNSFLSNQILVNKKPNISSKTLRLINNYRINNKNHYYKDNTYYENRNKRKKFSEEKEKNEKIVYYNREPYKKTINTYSNDNNRVKERNLFEELQNNKYLRPMLVTTNINKKLQKCKIGEPIKNICTLSLGNYFANMKLPFQNCQSPQNSNINDIYDEDNTYSYNLNNRTAMDRFNINLNNEYSPSNENLENITFFGKNNSSSFISRAGSYNYMRYSENDINSNYSNQLGRMKDVKDFYYEKKKGKRNIFINNKSPKIYHKNVISIKAPINVINKDIYNNRYYMDLKMTNDNKEKKLLKIYKNKLVEEFIIVLNKFIWRYLNKFGWIFFNNLINYKIKSKIYFRKKNSRINIKKLTLKDYKNQKKIQISLTKNRGKISDSLTNFNNISFSNEFKSSSLASNFRAKNNILNLQNSSFARSEQKQKKYYQSQEDSLNKYNNIRKKVIVHSKKGSGSQSKIIKKSPPHFETRESSGDVFIYRKKNLNNDNLYINKNNKINNLSYLKLNNNYNNIITNNKKGKIIDIDINLGKPVSIINDHSPLEEFFINNKPELLKLNTISSKIGKNNNSKKNKKNKAKSGSKNKIRPPLKLKRFVEEDDDEFGSNYNIINNRANSSMRRGKIHNFSFLGNHIIENNNNRDINREIRNENDKNIIKSQELFIRLNHSSFVVENNKFKDNKNKIYKNLRIKNDISIILSNNKNNEANLKGSSISNQTIKKNKANKLYKNCTKFLVKIFNKIMNKRTFIIINRFSKNN